MMLLCCFAFGIVANWHTIACYVRYGNPVDLRRAKVAGINDDAYMIEIDDQRFETTDSQSLALAKWVGIFGGDGEPPSITINGVWRSRTEPASFTVQIGSEFVGIRVCGLARQRAGRMNNSTGQLLDTAVDGARP